MVDGNIEIFQPAHQTAAIVASKMPGFRAVAKSVEDELSVQAMQPGVFRTGAYSRSFKTEKLKRRRFSDYYVYTDDPGQTAIEFGLSPWRKILGMHTQDGKYVFRKAIAVLQARTAAGK
jgi:hypothetical protein